MLYEVITKEARNRPKDDILLVNLSGRGDKDLDHVLAWMKSKDTK